MSRSAKRAVIAGSVCACFLALPGHGQNAAQTAVTTAATPNFAGVWNRNNGRMGAVRNLSPRPDVVIGDYQNPILQPWAAAIVKQHGDLERAGFAAPETKQSCWPGGVPNMLSIPSSIQLLQTPSLVTILYSNDHQMRFIYMNQPHSAHVTPSWYGESVGHYEGDTLVVDTVGLAVKPMSMVDVYGTPHTEALHVVERFHTINGGKALKVDIDVEDKGTFTAPWSEDATFAKTNNAFEEYVCAENNPRIGLDDKSGEMPKASYVAPF